MDGLRCPFSEVLWALPLSRNTLFFLSFFFFQLQTVCCQIEVLSLMNQLVLSLPMNHLDTKHGWQVDPRAEPVQLARGIDDQGNTTQ